MCAGHFFKNALSQCERCIACWPLIIDSLLCGSTASCLKVSPPSVLQIEIILRT
jgi:hypothetical protein